MAVSGVVKVRRDGVITLLDGAATSYTVAYEDGDFSADKLTGVNAADRVVIRDRGTIVGVRKGDDPVGSLSFNVHLRELTNSTAAVLLDFITGTQGTGAGAVALVSSGGVGYEQFMLDCKMTIDGQDITDSTATFSKVLSTADMSEGDPDKISLKGEVYGSVVYTGQA